ncbi:tetratricopeptide repeat protein, partial [Phenylobacterium aquaticum]|uniref:tetratricopeptide repeat protein n=1 Tax=Phenylobacterium aquaticum TaxID=1763816 RepID=UPI0026EB3463
MRGRVLSFVGAAWLTLAGCGPAIAGESLLRDPRLILVHAIVTPPGPRAEPVVRAIEGLVRTSRRGDSRRAALLAQAVAASKIGDLDAALAAAQAAVTGWPDDAEALFRRGDIQRLRGEDALAMKDLDQAIALDPGLASAYVARGVLHDGAGERALAMADYSQAITLAPE